MAHPGPIHSAVLVLFLLALALPARAMHVRSQSLPQAWSSDDRGLLIAELARGPNRKELPIEGQEFLAVLASPSADLAKLTRIELAAK